MKIHCLYDELVNPSHLKVHPKNRNKHPKEQIARLAEILEYQGWRWPVKVSKQSGCITAGHGRREAALLKRWEAIPVVYQDYESPEQEYADIQADNAIASWAEMDLAGINADVGDLGPNFNVDLLGIQGFTIDVADKGGQGDPDEIPAPPKKAKTQKGDLYVLGRSRLLCGDSTSEEDVRKVMAGEQADMVWTDPPYNVAYEGKTKDAMKIENDSMDNEQFFEFLLNAFRASLGVTKPGGSIYIAHADSEGANFRMAMRGAGWLLKQCLIWVKQSMVMGRQDYHWKHEPILYGWAPGASHNWYTDRKQTTVLEFDRPSRNGEHPTMKPIALIEYMIGNSCAPGGLVFDGFGGSGSTLIAAEKSGRRANLIELDPIYCDVIVKRWSDFTGQAPVLIRNKDHAKTRRKSKT